MFESIQASLQKVFARFGRDRRLTEDNIKDGLREIRTALLEADVHLKVARDLINEVAEKAVGEEVVKSITPGQMIIKIFADVLTEKMGPKAPPIPFASGNRPTVIMLAGLQGSGKTTTCGKLARLLQKKGRQPVLVAADLQRPAAVDQLTVLGQSLNLPVYSETGVAPPELCARAIERAKQSGRDVVLLDTAGRLHIDEPLMQELESVKDRTRPDVIYLVCDAMTGQDAVNSAKEFNDRLAIDGVILTKLDGDTRGGAAISIKAVTGKPVALVGMGEKLDALEEFHPDRMASRILGMGDVVSLVERARDVVDQEEAEEAMGKLLRDQFTFEDFLGQITAVKRMGPLKQLLEHLPGGMGQQMAALDPEGKGLTHVEAIIHSMTAAERLKPDLIDMSRRRRIARGSGTTLPAVNDLLKQFHQMRLMMRQLRQGGMLGRLAGRLMGGGKGDAEKAALIDDLRKDGKLLRIAGKDARELRKQRKQERQARKKNRKHR
ncbi:MAG: signal recognition particle protein [Planctomycetota bacterium]